MIDYAGVKEKKKKAKKKKEKRKQKKKKKQRGVDIAYKLRFMQWCVFEIPEKYIQNRTVLVL